MYKGNKGVCCSYLRGNLVIKSEFTNWISLHVHVIFVMNYKENWEAVPE